MACCSSCPTAPINVASCSNRRRSTTMRMNRLEPLVSIHSSRQAGRRCGHAPGSTYTIPLEASTLATSSASVGECWAACSMRSTMARSLDRTRDIVWPIAAVGRARRKLAIAAANAAQVIGERDLTESGRGLPPRPQLVVDLHPSSNRLYRFESARDAHGLASIEPVKEHALRRRDSRIGEHVGGVV